MADWEYDVFISYNRKDAAFVSFLEQGVQAAGLRRFRDVAGLGVYDKLDAKLKTTIARSQRLMAVISPAYLKSYWCLFEAMEAIQGQDFALRFMPIVLRYSPDDQGLDETFVMAALEDLDEQMRVFEAQMVATRAYALQDKLDKLAFVRSRLPDLFVRMRERIYPTFDLWDEARIRATMAQLLEFIAPAARVALDAVPLDIGPLVATPAVLPRLNPLPVVVWKAEVGHQAWRNTPVPIGNDVLVASSGEIWNEPDARDGIHCLHAETGRRRWFVHTPHDVNQLMVSKGLVVAGCDDGTLIAVRLVDGGVQWVRQLNGAIVGGPLKLPASIAAPRAHTEHGVQPDVVDPFCVVTVHGQVCVLDLTSGAPVTQAELGQPVIAPSALARHGYDVVLAIPGVDGTLFLVNYSGNALVLAPRLRVNLTYENRYAQEGWAVPDLSARPLSVEGRLLVGFGRETVSDGPPLAAIDVADGKELWQAGRKAVAGNTRGNLRAPPAVAGSEVLLATAYSTKLDAIALETGEPLWSAELGQGMFEQWSGPLLAGRAVFLGRQDGYLHKVSLRTRSRAWSMFLGDAARAGAVVAGSEAAPESGENFAWAAGASAPILATPVFDRGRLYVGTAQGWLFCLANLGDDTAGP
jgi:outer membrane protein assembly factor BamB